MQKSNDNKNSEEWVKKQSKRYPNKYYYFNTKTGTSRWANEDDTKAEDKMPEKISQPPRNNLRNTRRNRSTKQTPANDRLKLLQKTLMKNRESNEGLNMKLGIGQVIADGKVQANILTTNNSKTANKISKLSKPSVQDRLKIKPISVEIGGDIDMKEQNDRNLLCSNQNEDEPEFMDWEPIPEEIVLYEISTLRENKFTTADMTPDIISLRSLNTNDHNFYIVLDTNIFISNLKFLQSLNTSMFPQLKYTYLVVPYVVLQELDKLKQRRNNRISIIASNAIKFLNNSFTTNGSRLCGQSALKSSEHLIEIQNSDDKIINCCLQIATNSNRVVLLSNDINLRNKALFNEIQTYSKDDLENNKTNLESKLINFN